MKTPIKRNVITPTYIQLSSDRRWASIVKLDYGWIVDVMEYRGQAIVVVWKSPDGYETLAEAERKARKHL